jgi:hypothetical protein
MLLPELIPQRALTLVVEVLLAVHLGPLRRLHLAGVPPPGRASLHLETLVPPPHGDEEARDGERVV